MLGAALFRARRARRHRRARDARVLAASAFAPLLNLIETCVILGSVFFVGGLVGELIAGQRAELRELRRAHRRVAAEAGRQRSLIPEACTTHP